MVECDIAENAALVKRKCVVTDKGTRQTLPLKNMSSYSTLVGTCSVLAKVNCAEEQNTQIYVFLYNKISVNKKLCTLNRLVK